MKIKKSLSFILVLALVLSFVSPLTVLAADGDAEAAFLAEFEEAVNNVIKKEVATVTFTDSQIDVVFTNDESVKEEVKIKNIAAAAEALVKELIKLVDTDSSISINDGTAIDLTNAKTDEIVVAVAREILGGTSAKEFLEGAAIAPITYTATIKRNGESFTLDGGFGFKMGELIEAEKPEDKFLAEFEEAVNNVIKKEVATVTFTDSQIDVVFTNDESVKEEVKIKNIAAAAEALVKELIKLVDTDSSISINDGTAIDLTNAKTDEIVVAVAREILGGTSAKEFLEGAAIAPITYTATINRNGESFTLDGGFGFKMGPKVDSDAEAAFLAEFEEAVNNVIKKEVATVTFTGSQIDVVFTNDESVKEEVKIKNIAAAAEALVKELIKLVDTDSSISINNGTAIDLTNAKTDEIVVAVAREILGGTSAKEFLEGAAIAPITYTATINRNGESFTLDGGFGFKMGELIEKPTEPSKPSTSTSSSSGYQGVAVSAVPVTREYTQKLFVSDWAKAIAAEGTGATLSVRAINNSHVTRKTLDHVAETAKKAGKTPVIFADYAVGNAVVTRLYVEPAKIVGDLKLTMNTTRENAIQILFNKHLCQS